MKRLLLSIAAIIAIVTSCQTERLDMQSVTGSRTISMTALSEDSKTSIDGESTVLWGTGEYVKMYYNDGTDHLVTSDESSADSFNGQASAEFNFTIDPQAAANYTIGGIYPASAASAIAAGITTATIPAVQNATANSYDPAAFIMVVKPQVVNEIPANWQAWFRKATALNKITLKGVQGAVKVVEITADGKNLSGGATINLATGETTGYAANNGSVKIKYASALSAGDMDIWFTSWDCTIASGEKLTITAYGDNEFYTKTITARSEGIMFTEGKLNKLSVDFSSVAGQNYTLKQWAAEFVKLREVWLANTNAKGFVIPSDYSFDVGAKTYGRADAYDIACQGLNSLYTGSSFDMILPTLNGYNWSGDPYYPSGSFKNIFVNLDFLRNYTSRQQSYASSHSGTLANLCGYTNETTSGSPSIKGKGYNGDCALECHFLMMVRFYKYLLDIDFENDLASIEDQIHIKSGLYKESDFSTESASCTFEATGAAAQTISLTAIENWSAQASDSWITVSPSSGSKSFAGAQNVTVSVSDNEGATRNGSITFTSAGDSYTVTVRQNEAQELKIKDFAQQFVTVIDVWENNHCTFASGVKDQTPNGEGENHYIPASSKIIVGSTEYSTADMFEVALRSYLLLRGYDGNNTTKTGDSIPALGGSTMSGTKLPITHGYYWGSYPYAEATNGGLLNGANVTTVKVDILDNFSKRAINYASGKPITNFCGYGNHQCDPYTGCFCTKRALVTMARFFKYMLENELETATGITTEVSFDATMY